jgi:hypothetical protein
LREDVETDRLRGKGLTLLNEAQENLVRVWMLRESREEEATESWDERTR